MLGLGVPELVIILVIVLVLFGAKRLPEIGRQLGGGMREFKDSVTKDKDDDEAPAALPEAAAPPVAEAAEKAAAESDSAAQPRS